MDRGSSCDKSHAAYLCMAQFLSALNLQHISPGLGVLQNELHLQVEPILDTAETSFI
ncbi:hypothetical protein J6590_091164 [Homalodisca vitripennis]|nr:hypothetical protein J6590_091164 [Homalodisca vitripennis]